MKLEDGKGKNGDMSVSSTQRGNVSAKTRDRTFYASRDDGLAYTSIYDGITAAAGDIVAYLKNTSTTRNLFIRDLTFGGVNDIKWKIFSVSGTAAAGESVTPTQSNFSKNIPAEAIAMAGNTPITGLTNIAQGGVHRTSANNEGKGMAHGATILGPGDAIAVEYDTGTSGECALEIHFHYEDLGAS
jgi:hypothetical protein